MTALCWVHAPTPQFPLLTEDEEATTSDPLVTEVRRVLNESPVPLDDASDSAPSIESTRIHRVLHPEAIAAALEKIRRLQPEVVVAASPDATARTGGNYATSPLLRDSPCNTVILFEGSSNTEVGHRVLVDINDNPNDGAAVSLAARLAKKCDAQVTMAWIEDSADEQAIEVGRRELRQLMRDTGVSEDEPHNAATADP